MDYVVSWDAEARESPDVRPPTVQVRWHGRIPCQAEIVGTIARLIGREPASPRFPEITAPYASVEVRPKLSLLRPTPVD